MDNPQDIRIPDPPASLLSLEQEIRQTQSMLNHMLSIPWKDKSPGFKAGLMAIIGETCQNLASLLLDQLELQPGAMGEFYLQVNDVIDEIVGEWEKNGDDGGE